MENFNNIIEASRQRQLVPDDKFDRHMKMARVNDIESRKNIFTKTSVTEDGRRAKRTEINPSVY